MLAFHTNCLAPVVTQPALQNFIWKRMEMDLYNTPKYMFNTLQTRGTRGVSLVSNFMDPMSAIPLWIASKTCHTSNNDVLSSLNTYISYNMICIQVPTNYIISTETGHVRASPTLRHTHIVFWDTYYYAFKICFSWLNTPTFCWLIHHEYPSIKYPIGDLHRYIFSTYPHDYLIITG